MSKTELYQQMRDYLTQHRTNYMEMLQKMVAINSFTTNPAGVDQLGEQTSNLFTSLGFASESIQAANVAFGKHVVLTRNGRPSQKDESRSKHTIGLISHLDTVFPAEEEIRNNFAWREEGDRIYGPGTVDIKGGTVLIYMMMAAIQKFLPDVYDDITWVILLDAAEETDGADFGDLCLKHLSDNVLGALIFEAGHHQDGHFKVVAARKGMAVYHVTVEGKASHAGSAHESGANAIVQMADVIQQIAALTDYERELTFNVGTISGGTVTNRVPHQATAKVEMRAFSPEVYEQGVASMMALNQLSTVSSKSDGYPCRVTVEITRRTQPWSPNQPTDKLLAIWQAAGEELEYHVHREERGGLSDGNYFWHLLPSIDGLGPSGANAHCSERSEDGSKDQEFVSPDSFVPKAMLNIVAILNLIETTR